ncbi:MAG: hypothetical protein B7Z58_15865 [Acidiphilium sp. 37-64-53]|uniref:hypothetical protein n=1 Tax=Acidiphilium sp. 37-64-53 TaxID=1970299 RepID=UPI000BD633AB|nr:hypothetical protein [Acidiphilium sp. 37-64-53]OYW00323.1 MAG: hypothetical protein B7Z58_15865 [Acidiphilium sp. 37-64-53]
MIETSATAGVIVELRACAPEKNRFRSWRIEIDRDLFGVLNDAEAARFLRAKLRRRASGTRRRGAVYRVIDASAIAKPFIGTLLPVDNMSE